jgi:hypothetical protein
MIDAYGLDPRGLGPNPLTYFGSPLYVVTGLRRLEVVFKLEKILQVRTES